MELPADVAERLSRNWDALPGDVQERLQRAGMTPPAPRMASLDTLQTPEARAGVASLDIPKRGAQAVGALGGFAAAGPPGAGLGMGLAGSAVDVARGEADPARMIAQGLGAAALQSSGIGAGASVARQVIGSGLAQTLASQAYDLAKGVVTGQYPTLKEGAERAAGDFLGGVAGESLGRGVAANRAPQRAQAAADRATIAENTARYDRLGIESQASERLYGTRGSDTASAIERVPERFPIGRGAPAAMGRRKMNQSREAVRGAVDSISPAGLVGEDAAGLRLSPEVQAGFERFDTLKNAAFESVNAITGDEPVVPTASFRDALRSVSSLGQKKPIPAPASTGKLQGAMQPVQETMPVMVESQWPAFEAGLADAPFETIMTVVSENDKIPFWLARRIESELGHIAYRGGQPVGGIAQADARRLYGSLMRDFDSFFETEVGQQVQPQLAQAKDIYKTGRRYFNDTVARQFLEDSTRTPEQMFRAAFSPGNVTNTRYIRDIVPDEAWEAAAQGWAEGVYQKATTIVGNQEVFSGPKFASEVARYDRNGQLDVILGPDRAAQWRDLAATFRQQRESALPGANPSGTTQGITAAGQIAAAPARVAQQLYQGDVGEAALTAAGAFGLPVALGRLVTSPRGINAMTSALSPRAPMSAAGQSLLGGLANQGLQDADLPEFARWLAAQGGL